MIKMCSFCKQTPPMVRCRDCEQPAACFQCTVNKPTGGFCLDHYRRFIRLHWDNHKEELEEKEQRRGLDQLLERNL